MQEAYNPEKPFGEQIRKIITSTHPLVDAPSSVIAVTPHGKRYNIHRDWNYWKDYDEMQATDGIGTKSKVYWDDLQLKQKMYLENGNLQNGPQDALAMVIDDFEEFGYQLYMVQDHILIQQEDNASIYTLVRSLRDLCMKYTWDAENVQRPIIISGGETAIINTIQGFEMGITGTGKVERGKAVIPRAKEGDVIIGIESSGVHSNGLTFLREQLFEKQKLTLDSKPYGKRIGDELTVPTRIYSAALRELVRDCQKDIHGMVHITGGGLTKARELVAEEKKLNIEIYANHSLEPQELFYFVNTSGTSSRDMYRRFNNGIGYIVSVSPDAADYALSILRKHFPSDVIGKVKSGAGKVLIESFYKPSEKFEF